MDLLQVFPPLFYGRSGEEPLEASPDRSEPLSVLLCSFGPRTREVVDAIGVVGTLDHPRTVRLGAEIVLRE